MIRRLFLALPLLLACAGAEASEGASTSGVYIRLVAETPDAQGRLRGAVLLDLEPGWKTYWLDPGESGLPPLLDFARSQGVEMPEIAFPVPARFTEKDGSVFNGYGQSMAIAFETVVGDADEPRLWLDLSIGVCRDICVPVQASLDRDLTARPSLDEAMAIDRAFMALPPLEEASAEIRAEGGDLVLTDLARTPDDSDLFVSATGGWRFGIARREGADWRLPILARPSNGLAPRRLDAVVTAESGSARRLKIDIP